MKHPEQLDARSCVLLRLGERRFALAAEDIAELVAPSRTYRRFYLVAMQRRGANLDWVALPVSGECELITADLTPASESDSPHVAAWLSHDGEVIEVLNLDALTPGASDGTALAHSGAPEAHA